MLETIIGVSILVAVALFAKKVLDRNGSSKQGTAVGGVSITSVDTPRHDDGSVTPPAKEGQNEM